MPVQLLVLVFAIALPYLGWLVYAMGRPAYQPPVTSDATDTAADEWGFR